MATKKRRASACGADGRFAPAPLLRHSATFHFPFAELQAEAKLKGTVNSCAVIFPKSAPEDMPLAAIPPRHPSQLYEALLEGLFLAAYTQLRFWRSNVIHEKPGQLAGEFLALYAVVQAIGEIFREPDASLFFGLSRGTFYSLFLAIAGFGLIWKAKVAKSNMDNLKTN